MVQAAREMSEANKPQVGIIFSDVDGTLLTTDKRITSSAVAMIRRIFASGIPFCLVTARSPEGLAPVWCQLGLVGPMACFSEAYVLDADGTELFSRTIPVDLAVEVKRYLEKTFSRASLSVYGYHDWVCADASDPRVQRESRNVGVMPRECRDIATEFAGRGVHKFLLIGEPDEISWAERTIAVRYPQLNVTRSSAILCEIMMAGASKSHAVEVLCKHYGIDRTHAVAFGDGRNDIDMLAVVEQSYAMRNGGEDVRVAATYVTRWTNDESGVARTLAELVGDGRLA